jgi:archaellum biogenesis ATPase FlaH
LGLVIVIDALDEFCDYNKIRFVLQLLSMTTGLMAVELLIFLTSLPEISIRDGFAEIDASQRRHLILHRIELSQVYRDIHVFVKSHLRKVMHSLTSSLGLSCHEMVEELVL